MTYLLRILLVSFLPVAGFDTAEAIGWVGGNPKLRDQKSKPALDMPVWEVEELAALNRLIDRTRDQLDEQLHIKELFLKFEQRQRAAMKDPDDKEAMGQMVVAASHLLKAAQEARLTHLFSTEFLEELQAYDRIFRKRF
jgi:hypothetical protein